MRCCEEVTPAECHCAGCHRTFANLTLFDAHQDVVHGRTPPVICRDPAGLGMVQWGDRGVWCTPEGAAQRDVNLGRLAAARGRAQAGAGAEPHSRA